jgi:arginine exporter protein ArgO
VIDALVSGLLAGYGVAIPVGAIGALLVSLTARTSFAVGSAAALGVATADGLYATVAVLGGAAITGLIRPIATPLRWSACAVLLALAARTAWTAWQHHRDPARAGRDTTGLGTPRRAYLGLLGLTILNPATIVYFGALVLGRRADDGVSAWGQVLFVVGAFVASASWQLLLAGSGSLLGRALTGARGRLLTSMAASVVIAVLAVKLVIVP